ncbi:MAG: urease accessory protein UreD [Muribaculaceae bacterium]|nr:urease accessory protein UreD [Muribaculaceae bacterium]
MSFDDAPEMAPYLQPVKASYVGAPGKHGYLNLGFELDSSGKSILRELDRRTPLIVQQELYFDQELPGIPCVYILSSGGPNVDGDRYRQNISVGKDAMAFVSTGAATKLAEMKYNYSSMAQVITLDEGAYLEYLPEPIIPCRHTRFISDTRMVVHPTATVFYSEVYMGGRKYYGDGEMFEYDILSVCTHGERPDGQQLFREKFIIDPANSDLRDVGIMHGYDIFANVVVLTPVDKAREIYEKTEAFIDRKRKLAAGITHLPNGAGLLYKVLGMETGPVKETVRKFCSQVRQAVKGVPLPKEFPWR